MHSYEPGCGSAEPTVSLWVGLGSKFSKPFHSYLHLNFGDHLWSLGKNFLFPSFQGISVTQKHRTWEEESNMGNWLWFYNELPQNLWGCEGLDDSTEHQETKLVSKQAWWSKQLNRFILFVYACLSVCAGGQPAGVHSLIPSFVLSLGRDKLRWLGLPEAPSRLSYHTALWNTFMLDGVRHFLKHTSCLLLTKALCSTSLMNTKQLPSWFLLRWFPLSLDCYSGHSR